MPAPEDVQAELKGIKKGETRQLDIDGQRYRIRLAPGGGWQWDIYGTKGGKWVYLGRQTSEWPDINKALGQTGVSVTAVPLPTAGGGTGVSAVTGTSGSVAPQDEAQTTRELVDQLGPGDEAIIFYWVKKGTEGYYYRVQVDKEGGKTITLYDPSTGQTLGETKPLDWEALPGLGTPEEQTAYLDTNLKTDSGVAVTPFPLQVLRYEGRLWRSVPLVDGSGNVVGYDWTNEGPAPEDPEAAWRLQQKLMDYQFALNVRLNYYASQAALQKLEKEIQAQVDAAKVARDFTAEQNALEWENRKDERKTDHDRAVILLEKGQDFTSKQSALGRQQEMVLSLMGLQQGQASAKQQAQMSFLGRLIPEMAGASAQQQNAMVDYLERTGFPIRELAETFPRTLPPVIQAMTQRTPQGQGTGAPYTPGGTGFTAPERVTSPEELALQALMAQVTNQQVGPDAGELMKILAGVGAQPAAAGKVTVTLPSGNTVTVNSPAGAGTSGTTTAQPSTAAPTTTANQGITQAQLEAAIAAALQAQAASAAAPAQTQLTPQQQNPAGPQGGWTTQVTPGGVTWTPPAAAALPTVGAGGVTSSAGTFRQTPAGQWQVFNPLTTKWE